MDEELIDHKERCKAMLIAISTVAAMNNIFSFLFLCLKKDYTEPLDFYIYL